MVPVPQTIQEKTFAALQGDTNAFGTLFQWYGPRLLAHAVRICGNTPLAKDAVQETFISAFIHYSSLRDASSFYPWLKKILTNHCLHLLRKERATATGGRLEKKDSIILQSIEEKFERSASKQQLFEAMNNLSEELRSCVLLRYFSNYSTYEEIAQVLAIPVGTVRSRLAAAREKLLAYYNRSVDASDDAIKEAIQWSDYYHHLCNKLYHDWENRKEFIEHFDPMLNIRFTSGKLAQGRPLFEKEINEDLNCGTFFKVNTITSSGNISVIEGYSNNSPEYPDRCPPSSVLIMFRENGKVDTLHLINSPKVIDK